MSRLIENWLSSFLGIFSFSIFSPSFSSQPFWANHFNFPPLRAKNQIKKRSDCNLKSCVTPHTNNPRNPVAAPGFSSSLIFIRANFQSASKETREANEDDIFAAFCVQTSNGFVDVGWWDFARRGRGRIQRTEIRVWCSTRNQLHAFYFYCPRVSFIHLVLGTKKTVKMLSEEL